MQTGPRNHFQRLSKFLCTLLASLLFASALSACGLGRSLSDLTQPPSSRSSTNSDSGSSEHSASDEIQHSAAGPDTSSHEGKLGNGLGGSLNKPSQGPAVFEGTSSSTIAPVDPLAELVRQSEAYFSGPYLTEALDYFNSIAGNSEYGGATLISKWDENIRISVFGEASEEDLATLQQHVELLNRLPNLPKFSFDEENPNCHFYFVPTAELPNYINNYVKNNLGFFSVRWQNHAIFEAQIGISIDDTSQRDRSHLILEELTQSLGLFNDSYAYKESIFQQEHNPTQQLLPLDIALVRMLYDPVVSCGMSASEAVKALRRKYR